MGGGGGGGGSVSGGGSLVGRKRQARTSVGGVLTVSHATESISECLTTPLIKRQIFY